MASIYDAGFWNVCRAYNLINEETEVAFIIQNLISQDLSDEINPVRWKRTRSSDLSRDAHYYLCHIRHGRGSKNLPRSQIFLRCIRANLDLIVNAEHFAQIDRIDRIFDYECNHSIAAVVVPCVGWRLHWREPLQWEVLLYHQSSLQVQRAAQTGRPEQSRQESRTLCLAAGSLLVLPWMQRGSADLDGNPDLRNTDSSFN